MSEEKICPRCGKHYRGYPAISRKDNVTPICPLCGQREALESMGLGNDEIERIVKTIPNTEDLKE